MDPQATLKKQKKLLIQSIKEAEFMEVRRMKRLDQAYSKGEKDSLYMRFEKERTMDQSRIENLANDFKRLEDLVSSGSLTSLAVKREKSRGDNKLPPKAHKNRFAGIDNHDGRVFWQGICKRFESVDGRFNDKLNRPVFDERQEQQKLRLLNEKRDVLKALVRIHVAEVGANGGAASSARSTSSYSSYSSYSASNRSDRSSSSTRSYAASPAKSVASYATFATDSNRGIIASRRAATAGGIAAIHSARPSVPKLKL